MSKKNIDFFKNEKKINKRELPIEVLDVLIDSELDDENEFEYYFNSLNDFDLKEMISLGATAFDMRGDGETNLLLDCLVNLKVISTFYIYAVEIHLCSRQYSNVPAYAIYQLDNSDIHIIEFI